MSFQFDRATAGKIALALGAGVGAYVIYRTLRGGRKEDRWIRVGTISEIAIFPIKSCKGRVVDEVECLGLGPKNGEYNDRRLVIADASTGKFLTARESPQLVLIESTLENDVLTLMAPGKQPVKVDLTKTVADGKTKRVTLWENMPVDAFDCGDQVADWITEHATIKAGSGERYRLYYHTPGLYNTRSLDNYPKLKGWWGKRNDLAVFPDLTPYMMMTEASMVDLNTRTPDGEKFSIRNFRPNFVVAGTKPFDEDNWVKVRIGEQTEFTNVKACTRCLLTTINWATGEKHPRQEPLRTLRSYRITTDPVEKKYYGSSPMLGVNLAIDRLGRVKMGDPVYVTYKNQ